MYLTGKRRAEVLNEVTSQGVIKSAIFIKDGEKVMMEVFRN
jgi:hypothetical protein